jgi:hypothetical protein
LVQQPKTAPDVAVKPKRIATEKDKIEHVGKMMSIKKDFDPHSALGVSLKIELS